MAGSSRDVELVIRARDEATKAITSVGDALKILAGVQNDVGGSAQKTDGLLGELSSSLSELQRQASGLQALGTVAKQIDRAADAVARLENTSAQAGAAAQTLIARQGELAQAGERLNASLGQQRAALEGERAALARAEAAHARLSAQVDRMAESYRKSRAAVIASKAPTEEMQTAARSHRDSLIALNEQHGQSEKGITAQKAKLAELTQGFGALEKEVTANGSAQTRIARDVTVATEAFDRSQQTLEKARTELTSMQAAGRDASVVLGGVAVSQEDVAAASKQTAASINEVTDALKRQKAAPQETTSGGPAAAATAAYRRQIKAVQQARQAWEAAAAEAKSMGREIATAEAPTREMTAAFVVSKARSDELRQAYLSQAQALNTLRGVTQGSFKSFMLSSTALVEAGNAARMAAQGLKNLPPISRMISSQLTASIRGLVTALFRVPEAADEAGNAIRRAGGAGRESLSIFQRMRGEVLSLILSFGGLYAAVSAVESVTHTLSAYQNAQARMAVVFDGDQARARQEMTWLMSQAERLGISFDVLSGEYSKVAIAAREMGISNEGARTVFLALAEAGRVVGADASETSGIFQGLAHSIDRGTLNARNFDNQIGQRIPGSMKAMADAVGVSVEKFTELQRAGGGVAANENTLVKFAENLKTEFSGELPQALDTVTAQLGRLKTFMQEKQLEIGEGGFTDSLKKLIGDLENLLNSDAGSKGFQELGSVLGRLVDGLRLVVDNFGSLTKAAELFAAVRIASFVLNLVSANGKLSGSLKLAQADVRAFTGALATLNMERMAAMWGVFRAQVIAAGSALASIGADGAIAAAGTALVDGAMGALNAIMVGVAATARAMWVAIGGFPGLLLTGATFILSDLLGKWMSGLDDANSAMSNHAALLQRVIDDYNKAADGADTFAQKALKSSSVQIIADQLQSQKDLQQRRTDVVNATGDLGSLGDLQASSASEAKLLQLMELFKQGKISAIDLKAALNQLALADPQLDKTVIAGLQDLVDKAGEAELRIKKDDAALRLIAGSASDADKSLLGIAHSVEQLNGALSTTALDQYNDALQKLQTLDPVEKPSVKLQQTLDKELQTVKDALGALKLNDSQIAQALNGSAIAGVSNPDILKKATDAVAQYKKVIGDLNSDFQRKVDQEIPNDKAQNIVPYIFQREGFGDNRGSNGNSHASGFGQFEPGTWLTLLSELKPALDTLSESARLALRNNKAIATEVTALYAQKNTSAFVNNKANGKAEPIDPTVRNLYLAHFLGAGGAIKVILANPKAIAAAIDPSAAAANKEVFYKGYSHKHPDTSRPRTVQELLDWASPNGSGVGAEVTSKGVTKQDEFDAQLAEFIKTLKDATAAINQSPRDAFIQQKVSEQEKRAQSEGTTFSEPQRQQVTQAAAQQYDAQDTKREAEVVAQLTEELKSKLRAEQQLTKADFISASAAKDKINLLSSEGYAYATLKGQLFDLQKQEDAFNKVSGLADQRKDLVEQLKEAFKGGDLDKVKELQQQIAQISADIKSMLPDAMAFAKAMDDQKMVATLTQIAGSLGTVKTTLTDTKQINQQIASGLTNTFTESTDALGKFITGGESLKQMFADIGQSFLKFAADFLQKIAEMIVQQEILNLLGGQGQNGIGGSISGWVNGLVGGSTGVGVQHGGGLAGQAGGMTRSVMSGVFAGARRMHGGGIAGILPGEVPTILKKNEEVLTESDPRHAFNGGGAAGAGAAPVVVQPKIVNAFDPGTVVSEALNTTPGQKAFVNFVRQNRRTLNQALGSN